MARNIYYRYNPETDNYERVYATLGVKVLSGLRLLLLSCLFGAVFFCIAYYGFASPGEDNLKEENEQLSQQLTVMEKRVDGALKVMDEIRNRDDNLYRVMMQMEPVNRAQRYAGLDNDSRYAQYAGLSDEKILVTLARNIDILERSLYAQSISFDKLREALASQSEKLAHTPSVLPINVADFSISSGFGNRIDPVYGTTKFHAGLDFPADVGDPVFATAKGCVTFAGWKDGYGNCIDIDHGYGYTTRFGHLNSVGVKTGQTVVRGDKIGEVGNTGKSTGPHLHYEVRLNDEPQNPVNYYFMDLTPAQYDEMVKQAENAGRVMD